MSTVGDAFFAWAERKQYMNLGSPRGRQQREAFEAGWYARQGRLSNVRDEINGLMDSLDEHVIADEDERMGIYDALRELWRLCQDDAPQPQSDGAKS